MKRFHPLVQKTKIELARLDKLPNLSWEEQKKYRSEFLPISVEPKLRARALKFMDDLIKLLEENGHSIKFEYNRCYIEMYGQLTEIYLSQKCFRKRIKDNSGYARNTYEKSNKLEFEIGSSYRKGWIDRKTKRLEDYIPVIYSRIEKESKRMSELRKRQRIEEEQREKQRKLEEEKARLQAIEEEKFNKLISDTKNYNRAIEIRAYLKVLEEKASQKHKVINNNFKEYIEWGYKKADEIDPLKLK